MIMKRIFGLIMLLTGLTIMTFALIGAYFAGDAIGRAAEGISTNLTLAADSLNAAGDTLELSRNSLGDVVTGLDSVVAATANASRTLEESRPLIDNVAVVTSQEVPEAIEGMQAALPNLIEVASVVDATLKTLSTVGIDRDIPLPFGGSIPLRFDLGINYNPTVSFDASLRTFSDSLEGLPESLRGLENDLQATNSSLATMSGDLQATADNLSNINDWVRDTGPLLDQYIDLIERLQVTIEQAEARLDDSLRMIRIGAIAALVAIGLTQLAPIYLGWELLTGRRHSAAREYVPQPNEEGHAS